MKNNKTLKNAPHRGFTLIELMVGIAVIAIIIAIGVPSFNRLISSQTTAATASRLSNALAYARSEAVTRSTNVTICASDDGATCSGSSLWNNGWIVFLDNNTTSGSTGSVDTNEEVLKVEDIDSLSVGVNGDAAFVAYNRLGESINGVSGSTLDFTVAGRNTSTSARIVAVNKQGSVSVKIDDGVSVAAIAASLSLIHI